MEFKTTSIQKKHFYLTWAVLSAFVLVFAFTSPINVDEVLHYNHAKNVVGWFSSGGEQTACLNTPHSHLKYYGQSVDNVSAFINRIFNCNDEYLTRHLIGAVMGMLLILVIGLLAIELGQNSAIGILAMLLFFISPRPMGQLVNNLKDIPFALGYAASTLLLLKMYKSFPVFKWKQVLALALLIAFTNSVRIGGLVLFAYLALVLFVAVLRQFSIIKHISFWKNWIPKLLVILCVGYFAALILWPYALVSPLKHPIDALHVMEHYKISIRQVFDGRWIWSTALPWYYLPVWLLISIPEAVWLGFMLFVVNWMYSPFAKPNNYSIALTANIPLAFILFTFLFPTVYVILINANLYSGWRQMYFIYPSMVVLSAYGIQTTYIILKPFGYKVFSALMLLLCVYPASYIFTNMNPDYIYYNAMTEGNKNAREKYEYDYYWHQMQQAVEWLNTNIPQDKETITIATNFDLSCYEAMDKRFKFVYTRFMERAKVDYDYAVLEANYLDPYQIKNEIWMPGGVIKIFKHNNIPLIVVLKSKGREAFLAHQAFDNKDFVKAEELFEKAVRNDYNNLNLQAYLAKCYLISGKTKEFLSILYGSTVVNPNYEPLKLLEAEFYHRQKNYWMARRVLEKLLKVNPRFTDALPMLQDSYDKTSDTVKMKELKIKYQIN